MSPEELRAWFAGSIPDDWFTEAVDVVVDRDEIIVSGVLAAPKVAKGDDPALAAQARIEAFRESSREDRIGIALRAEQTFFRNVSWEASCGEEFHSFTRSSVPVMSRLHFEERQILDTLIDAGVARSRSDALAWCVRLVADNESEWLDQLRAAMTELTTLRDVGPSSQQD